MLSRAELRERGQGIPELILSLVIGLPLGSILTLVLKSVIDAIGSDPYNIFTVWVISSALSTLATFLLLASRLSAWARSI